MCSHRFKSYVTNIHSETLSTDTGRLASRAGTQGPLAACPMPRTVPGTQQRLRKCLFSGLMNERDPFLRRLAWTLFYHMNLRKSKLKNKFFCLKILKISMHLEEHRKKTTERLHLALFIMVTSENWDWLSVRIPWHFCIISAFLC